MSVELYIERELYMEGPVAATLADGTEVRLYEGPKRIVHTIASMPYDGTASRWLIGDDGWDDPDWGNLEDDDLKGLYDRCRASDDEGMQALARTLEPYADEFCGTAGSWAISYRYTIC